MVVMWLALLPHSKKIPGSDSHLCSLCGVCMLFLYLNGLFPGSPSNHKHAWLIRDSRLAMEKRFFREVLNKEPYECMIKYI